MPQANYNSTGIEDKVWKLAKPIPGVDRSMRRQDPYGNTLAYSSYGKSTSMGWDIDHIKPQSRGGSHCIGNLQALQTHINRSKGNSLVKKSRHNG
jgi:hypothetical protein